ncbi:hypothetical protein PNC201_07075 [Pseudoalteromonas sp. NC201]|nr:hypothetical protein PNC201_07075 [Pseudoalteromonas sp. NC201]
MLKPPLLLVGYQMGLSASHIAMAGVAVQLPLQILTVVLLVNISSVTRLGLTVQAFIKHDLFNKILRFRDKYSTERSGVAFNGFAGVIWI